MADHSIRIKKVRISELTEFAQHYFDTADPNCVVPLSKLRAHAHSTNPYADPDDVALVVAMRGSECIGYIGLLPGILRDGQETGKIYWYTTWFVHPDVRHTSAGGMLILATLSLDYDLVAADMAPQTVAFYQRLGFISLGPLPYYEMNLNHVDPIAPAWLVQRALSRRRGRRIKWIDTALAASRAMNSRLFFTLVDPLLAKTIRGFEFRELAEPPLNVSILNDGPTARFYRGTEVVRWMLQHPWTTDQSTDATPGYYFSDFRPLARFVVLEARPAKLQSLSYLVLSISRDEGQTTVKALDHSLTSGEDHRVLLAAALTYARRYRANRVLLPEQISPCVEASSFLRLLFRRKHRLYFCRPRQSGSMLKPNPDRIRLDFCDGDSPFT